MLSAIHGIVSHAWESAMHEESAVKTVLPTPAHPAVDWLTLSREGGRARVQITCPACRAARFDPAAGVAYRIKAGSFSGFCYRDRLLHTNRAQVIRIDHPTLDWSQLGVAENARQRYATVLFTCQRCAAQLWKPINIVQAQLRQGTFTGHCPPCAIHIRDQRRNPAGRKVGRVREKQERWSDDGYVRLNRWAIPEEDRWLFDAMGTNVREHRMVMAKALGRPLESYELIDHMNGNWGDNALENLRVYVRGKDQPGSHNGHGTYYHEWQMAEARVRELEALLK